MSDEQTKGCSLGAFLRAARLTQGQAIVDVQSRFRVTCPNRSTMYRWEQRNHPPSEKWTLEEIAHAYNVPIEEVRARYIPPVLGRPPRGGGNVKKPKRTVGPATRSQISVVRRYAQFTLTEAEAWQMLEIVTARGPKNICTLIDFLLASRQLDGTQEA